jgi:hypothetical protein
LSYFSNFSDSLTKAETNGKIESGGLNSSVNGSLKNGSETINGNSINGSSKHESDGSVSNGSESNGYGSESNEIQPKKQRIDNDGSKNSDSETVYPFLTCCSTEHKIDSVFNVCLEVVDVDKLINNIVAANSHSPRAQAAVIIPPKSIKGKSFDNINISTVF